MNNTNIEHKLIPLQLSRCFICNREEPDFTNLSIIRKREKLHVELLTQHLGRRSLDVKYSFKYLEDDPIKKESKYLNPLTGHSYLWTVCNCERVAHPDCFLQALRIHFRYNCHVCKENYRLGYKSVDLTQNPLAYSLVYIITLLGLLTISILFMANEKFDFIKVAIDYQRFIKVVGLLFLCIFLAGLSQFVLKFIKKSTSISQTIDLYFLPYPFKYEFNYGIEKVEMMNTFISGGTVKDLIGNAAYRSEREHFNPDTGAGVLQKNCPFFKELAEEDMYSTSTKGAARSKYDYCYQIESKQIAQRFIQYLEATLGLDSIHEIINHKIERENFFCSLKVRNEIELKMIMDVRSLIVTKKRAKFSTATGSLIPKNYEFLERVQKRCSIPGMDHDTSTHTMKCEKEDGVSEHSVLSNKIQHFQVTEKKVESANKKTSKGELIEGNSKVLTPNNKSSNVKKNLNRVPTAIFKDNTALKGLRGAVTSITNSLSNPKKKGEKASKEMKPPNKPFMEEITETALETKSPRIYKVDTYASGNTIFEKGSHKGSLIEIDTEKKDLNHTNFHNDTDFVRSQSNQTSNNHPNIADHPHEHEEIENKPFKIEEKIEMDETMTFEFGNQLFIKNYRTKTESIIDENDLISPPFHEQDVRDVGTFEEFD